MINNKKVVALIPARGGSKSIPQKNIAILGEKPLIAWTIESALQTPEIDKVIVSTDCEQIANISKEYGAEVLFREDELAQDDSLVIDTIRSVLEELNDEYDYIVILEPTAPLRSIDDISKSITLLDEGNFDSVATYTEAALNPHRAWRMNNDVPEIFIEGAIPWLPRQKLPIAYQLNGAVYVAKVKEINENSLGMVVGNSGAIIMPKERSIDIDHKIDLLVAEALINEKR